ncbi:hypothetical protein GW17_00001946 [Ensete ventricosum]|uniref:Uncharacterized protein n=1 Tax=Ensete ventricosum TaxID=4639 RepID=A0A426YEF7_ENSVE|nr:hypothetical protein B296_00051953 [Ensete ventricosum]RWW33332.1 hypothetical protein GW17_00001946 [Ensete ventricosum]RZR98705.1 hypothetical protein BHM03_00028118 [Ensete ventricosum]
MSVSRPAVHPVEAPPLTDAAENPPRVRMKEIQGMPGTPGGLALRLSQFVFAAAALGVMVSASDFASITATLTFAAACASSGITVLIGNDLNICSQNHCTSFETATAMAFISWFAVCPSFLMNFWSLACR